MSIPDKFYRYYKFDSTNESYIEDIMVNSTIFFSPPKIFNDPFDCKLNFSYDASNSKWRKFIIEVLKKYSPHLNRQQRAESAASVLKKKPDDRVPKDILDAFTSKIGVLCLSEKRDDILMWSYYAQGHTGFCAEFIATEEPFFLKALKVNYQEAYPEINFVRDSMTKKADAALLTKADFWQHEEEWRIINHTKGPGLYKFPEKLLSGIIFGCQMPEDNKQKIINWCCKRTKPVSFYQAIVREKEYRLKIETRN